MNEQIKAKFGLIFTKDEMERISVGTAHGECRITADVHGMTCAIARRFINNIINLVHTAFHLLIIHGYHGGDAIKHMLLDSFENSHISKRYSDVYNQGRTHLVIA